MLVQDIPLPTIQQPTDVVVRITTPAICDSDLHIYRGFSGSTPPWTIGREAIGCISELRSAVSSLEVGEYVIITDTPSYEHLTMTPQMGDYCGNGEAGLSDGLELKTDYSVNLAEYARVAFADYSLIPIPLTQNTTISTIEQDYLTPGDSVVAFGASPVGLLAAYTAILQGASHVYSINHVDQRLERAASIGALVINSVSLDPVAAILAQEHSSVARSVDYVQEDIVIGQAIAITAYGGGVPISPNIIFPMTEFWGKQLSFKGGSVDPKL
ncbi:GroES-like protein [Byssothecium circinans]|uniref:GroES-like protein n=1 Tax=Byssothecium circinans TaxID=147558 RepID=A0A6A5U8K5_9PLEO|nr:GroES-like protein [Byssothecium circinans]